MPAERLSLHIKDEVEGNALRLVIREIMDSCFDPGYTQRWYAHQPCHLWYIMEGRAHVGVEGKIDLAVPGDVYYIPPWMEHYLAMPGPGPCRIFDVKFDLEGSVRECSLTRPLKLHDEFGVRHLVERMLSEAGRRPPAWETSVRGLFNEIVGEVLRRHLGTDTSPAWPEPVRAAVAYIEANFARRLQLEDVAAHVCFSPKYLAFLFKRATGYTVKEYLTLARIERAKIYLAGTDMPIGTVGERVGYASIHYFSRVFRSIVGVPPGEYRRNHRRR